MSSSRVQIFILYLLQISFLLKRESQQYVEFLLSSNFQQTLIQNAKSITITKRSQKLLVLQGTRRNQLQSIFSSRQMGNLTNIFSKFSTFKAQILMLGLDSAGKTTILYQFKLKKQIQTIPTIGFNLEQFKYKNLHLTIWDVGGQSKLVQIWHHYYHIGDAVIYVLDSSDNQRIETAKETLHGAISHHSLNSRPILIFANKIDLATLNILEITQRLDLKDLKRQWFIQPCCALNGEGLMQGLDWLRKILQGKVSNK